MIQLSVALIALCGSFSYLIWLAISDQTYGTSVVLDVTEFGVYADGIHDDTLAMQRIFDNVVVQKRRQIRFHSFSSWIQQEPVAIVLIPFGRVVVSGPLSINSSNLVLQVDGQLQAWDITPFYPDILNGTQWPFIPPLPTYGDSRDGHYYQYQPFLYITNVAHFRITGSGIIDGYGQPWWDLISSKNQSLHAGRPNLVQIVNSSEIGIDSVTFQNSPFWTIHPVLSHSIHIHHVTIKAPLYAPNVDGIDPDSCEDVLIEYVHIECGDDHIAVKAGVCGISSPNNCSDPVWSSGIYRTKNIVVRHSTFGRGMGIAIGSEMSGGISNVTIYNNTIGLCDTGAADPIRGCGWGPALHVKTTIARGGDLNDIVFYNNTVWNTSMFILLEIGYQTNSNELPPNTYDSTKVQNIAFIGNVARGSATAASFSCSKYDACHTITIIGNYITAARNTTQSPWNCRFIADDYIATNNFPPGLEECLATSMRNTSVICKALHCPVS